MADARRTKRARPAPEVTVDAPAEAQETVTDEDSERQMGRMFALGLPVVGVVGALGVGAFSGLAPGVLVLAGATLLGTIGFFWASIRTLSGDAPLPRGVASYAIAPRVPAPERKRETLRALKDLELEHSIGKIDDADFAELSLRYRTTAKALMREIDAGLAPRRAEAEELVAAYLAKKKLAPKKEPERELDTRDAAVDPGLSPTPGARLECAKCSVSNEPDAAFCKKCGAPLAVVTPLEEKHDAAV